MCAAAVGWVVGGCLQALDKVFDPAQEALKPIKEVDFDEATLNMVRAQCQLTRNKGIG
jgi:hypothetical protein